MPATKSWKGSAVVVTTTIAEVKSLWLWVKWMEDATSGLTDSDLVDVLVFQCHSGTLSCANLAPSGTADWLK